MNGLADGFLTGDAIEGSRKADGSEIATKETGSLPCALPCASEEPYDPHTPDLRWLGVVSCLGSAVITLVCGVLIAGQLFLSGDEKVVAEGEVTPPGYSVAGESYE
jgi:hypothetical protein